MAKAPQRGATIRGEIPAHEPRRWGRWLRPIALLLGVIVVGAGIYQVTRPQAFPVRTMRVSGDLQHVTREQLRQVVEPYMQAGLLRLDVAAVRAAVQALPWVYRASVRRVWPDVVAMTIEEQKPLAHWGTKGLVNADGELFMPGKIGKVAKGLPEFEGPDGSSQELTHRYAAMQRALSPLGLKITQLVLDQRRSWRLQLSNGMGLMLGREDFYPRLLRFVRVYADVLARQASEIERVDLRYTNGFAVRWKAGHVQTG